ncbi:HupE/UreJ family protein [Phaeodactylibacter luteus]|uniref:HupE/UreJ family protein n=1 Tax=Phaeodactylibacter luteus TaxID=1564516 RepID=A0A5C6RR51_9BACT|nr:HupE/UreJ family protein [Phaeodactylibacter luteus]TXB64160.1 HupE/UreJ family protein [Phaeodactylibacter luteus]
MQSVFSVYLQLGFTHISDLAGYDHILFIVALCAIYRLAQWRQVALLATAFTLGHSLTLGMAALGWLPVNMAWIEFLIPITILATALFNITAHRQGGQEELLWGPTMKLNYGFALAFGLIHGMGFSNFLRSSLLPGQENQLLTQLLAFNIGVELGQLAIVAVVLGLSFAAMQGLKVRQREWNLFVSGAAFGLALVMALERVPA